MSVTPAALPAAALIDRAPDVPKGDLTKAAQAFEAIFVRQMLASARAADFGGDDLFGGPGLAQFEALRDEHLAEMASQSGTFGFAKLIEAQLAAHLPPGEAE